MSQTANTAIAVIGIDIGKNSFHVVAEVAAVAGQVCSTPNNRHSPLERTRPFGAITGLMHRSKQ